EVSSIVFSDERSHEFVNSLIHPLVMSELERLSRKYVDSVLEVPLLFEAGHHEWVDTVIYVAADFETRARRCELQRKWSINELMRRERFLLPREDRIAMSDYVIHNDKSILELEEQIKRLGERLHERK
ncbi:MAG: dephospho-CoA kinase, partial [Synergistaceae bacterium]|nr:dephospho-CoA kinase [Synergistaceae bacterium]